MDASEIRISYFKGRHPQAKRITAPYGNEEAARVDFVGHVIRDALPRYWTPTEKVTEAYATKGGKVLVLIAEKSGYWRTDLWAIRAGSLHVETISTQKSKRLASSQIMSVFGGLCAAERAA